MRILLFGRSMALSWSPSSKLRTTVSIGLFPLAGDLKLSEVILEAIPAAEFTNGARGKTVYMYTNTSPMFEYSIRETEQAAFKEYRRTKCLRR